MKSHASLRLKCTDVRVHVEVPRAVKRTRETVFQLLVVETTEADLRLKASTKKAYPRGETRSHQDGKKVALDPDLLGNDSNSARRQVREHSTEALGVGNQRVLCLLRQFAKASRGI